MVVAVTLLVIMFLVYNYLVFELMDTILEKSRLKKLYRIPVCVGNTLIVSYLVMVSGITSLGVYGLIFLLMLAEFIIFYRDTFARSLFCVLACALHIMAIRALCVAGFAIATNLSINEVTSDPFMLAASTGVTVFFLNLALLAVIRFISAKDIRIINQHKEQLWFMSTWSGVFCAYLLLNARVYSMPNTHPTLLDNQIAAPIAILVGMYIVLFFAIKTTVLLGYRDKNEKLQIAVDRELQYRASVEKDVLLVAEVNFTQNKIISGFEEYALQAGERIYNYHDMLIFAMETVVYAEDKEEFERYASPTVVIETFEQGAAEINFDYRRRMPDGTYAWMRVFMPLMRDQKTGDVKGFLQIKDIDVEKKQQLALQYKAETDLLTKLYNKATTEKLIEDYLLLGKVNSNAGALFIIDIDNFKTINDHLGHLYGDAVLSELSETLKSFFREDDIVGRIGGDEFLVFAKGIESRSTAIVKASAICDAFLRTYTNERNECFLVSGSVGISLFPEDGATFEELFKGADTALYATKAKGKNSYSFYQKESQLSYTSTRTEIDSSGFVQKSFRENRIEYVFRLLYGSDDTKMAIESVLELIAKNFGFSRANIFEFNILSTHFTGVFEWCANGIASVSHLYVNLPVSDFDFVVNALEQSGGMFLATPADFPEDAQDSYNAIGIKSIVHFSIKEHEDLIGVVAFQNCTNDYFELSAGELEELRIICQVLSVFMAKQLNAEREARHHKAVETVVDNTNSIAYVVDRETYEVFYENQNVVDITGHVSIGTKCHQSYRGLDAPCGDCPLQYLSDENPRCTLELFTKKFDIFTKTSASLIDWSNDKKSLLISSVDITEYKRGLADE